MNPASDPDYRRLISELIKKQMVILGPDITLAKARNVPGLSVGTSGEIQSISRDSKAIFNELSNQFVELSSLIVEKTIESVLQAGTDEPNQLSVPPGSQVQNTLDQLHQIATPYQAELSQHMAQNESVQPSPKPFTVPSPDQKIDPLVQEVHMPDDNFFLNKKSDPPSFTLSELESLNKALKKEASQNKQASY